VTLGSRRLVSALLLGVLLYGAFIAFTGFPRMQDSLSSFHWLFFVAALSLSTTNYFFRYLRWEYYLRRLDIRDLRGADSLLVFLSGFVLTVTPGKVGEVFKSAVLKAIHGVPMSRTAPIVIAERLADVIAVVVLILLGSASFEGGLVWAGLGTSVILVGVTVIVWEKPSSHLLAWMARHRSLSRFEPKLREAIASLRLLASPSALVLPLGLSVVAWACEGLGLWTLLVGFGANAPVALAIFFYSTASLAGALIPVPGGLGVVETMLQQQLVHVAGVAPGAATSSMILVRFATLWWAVVIGFVALGLLRSRHPELRGQG